MRNVIANRLRSMGYTLVSTRFGVYGDWAVVDANGNSFSFTTLGAIRRWIDRQTV